MSTATNLDLRLHDHSSRLHVAVAPTDGGRVRQTTAWGVPLLHDAPSANVLMGGSYPMAPWAGRVRDGRFDFDGAEYTLAPNVGPHPLHGVAFDRPWTVVASTPSSCHLSIDLEWVLGGRAEQTIELVATDTAMIEVRFVLAVTAGERAMPAVIGWHPCFRPASTLETSFTSMYRRDAEGVAIDELVDVAPLPWDDCFVAGPTPPRLVVDGITVVVETDCDHCVVYTEDPSATCVEPQSGPPDAFHGVGPGPEVLRAGQTLRRTMTWRLTPA